MLLAIDIGNTNTVFAVYKGTKLLQSWRCQSIASRTADEYGAFLSTLLCEADIGWKELSDIIISSVVPAANFQIKEFCRKYIKKDPLFVTKDVVGVKIDLDNPDEVGADRLVNAVAVIEHYKTPAIVIDFGTATTFDVIDGKKRYAGGAIAPGINLSVSALHQAAAQLPSISIKKPKKAIGKNTVGAMQSGIYWGYIGLIEGIVAQMTKELGAKPFVLATGGLAPLFADNTKTIHAVDDELTLKGLLKIHKDQKKK